jgi:type I restriction enzyme S subunit
MKISYSEYIKKANVSVLVAESIFTDLLSSSTILKVKDVAKTTSGGTPNRSNPDFYNGAIPWLKSGELNDGVINESEEFITEVGLNNSSAKLHPEGTLLVAMYGATAGKAGILNFKASTNQAVCAIYPNDKIERDYLFWFFRSHRFQFIEKSKGGAQPNISQTVINETPIPVPDKALQANISELLFQVEKEGTVDLDSIPEQFRDSVYKVLSFKNSGQNISTELTHQLDLVKQLRQAFLREAMQGKLVPQDLNDEPASVLLEKIKAEKERLIKEGKIKKSKPLPPISEDEIPFEIPENWVWCRLGELTTYGSSPKAEPSDLKPNTWVLDLEDIEKETSKLLCKVRFKERNSLSTKSKFEVGDVLYSKLRPYLDKVIVADESGVCTTEILPLKTYAGMNSEFLRFSLKRSDFLSYVNSVTKGMKMPRLGTKEGEMALMPIPPLFEQQRIVAKLDELMQYCDELEASIKESQQQNELLLQQVLREVLEPASAESTADRLTGRVVGV